MNNNKLILYGGIAAIFLLMSNNSSKGVNMSENEKKYRPLLEAAAKKYGIPPEILVKLAKTESAFNPNAVGKMTKVGQAKGIMQIMTSQHPTVKNPFDPVEAIDYGAKFLASLYKRFGQWKYAVAAYNAGGGTVSNYLNKKSKRLPSATVAYVKKILNEVV